MTAGIECYVLGRSCEPQQVSTLDRPICHNLTMRTAFVHDGRAVVCGTATGRVYIWDFKDSQRTQVLLHGGPCVTGCRTTTCSFLFQKAISYRWSRCVQYLARVSDLHSILDQPGGSPWAVSIHCYQHGGQGSGHRHQALARSWVPPVHIFPRVLLTVVSSCA